MFTPDRSVTTPILTGVWAQTSGVAMSSPATRTTAWQRIFVPPGWRLAYCLLRPGFVRPAFPSGSDTQIGFELAHICFDRVACERIDDPSSLDDVVPVRHRRRKTEILLDQEDRVAPGLQGANDCADLLDDHRSQALGRLVEQEQRRA